MPALMGLRVLIVEDQPLLALDYADELSNRGATTEVAFTLEEALQSLAGRLPDFALLDVNLGQELSWPAAILLAHRHVPYFLVSGYSMQQGLPAGVSPLDCLEKPITAHAIAERVRQAA